MLADPRSKIRREGMSDETKHVRLLRRMPDPPALGSLLDRWMHGDEAEQQETFAVLRRSLDEDCPEGYKLFSRA